MSRPLAEAFHFCPFCGVANSAPRTSPLDCSRCHSKFFFGPVAAVGAIVADAHGRVLFVRRAKDPCRGKLGLPGGFVDGGETLEEAVVREVLEEANLNIKDIDYLTSGPNDYVYQGNSIAVTDVFFACTVESFEPMKAIDGEVSEFHLVQPTHNELNEMAFPSNRIAVELYLRDCE